MTAKHIGLGMTLTGAAMVLGAFKMDSKSSFENGSFMIQIFLGLAGAAMGVVGVIVAVFG